MYCILFSDFDSIFIIFILYPWIVSLYHFFLFYFFFFFRKEMGEFRTQNCTSLSDCWMFFICESSLGWPGVWGIKGLTWSAFHSETFRPSQLCWTCIWKGRRMFYISFTKQWSPFLIFPQHLVSSCYSSFCFNYFLCVLYVKTALSHSHIVGLYGRMNRMLSRCSGVAKDFGPRD